MFEITTVEKLLIDRHLKTKDLLNYLGRNYNGGLRQAINRDPKSSVVEKIADFFNLPMDYFFNREMSSTVNNGVISSGTRNRLENINIGCDTESLKRIIEEKDSRLNEKERLIEEKDRTIRLLEKMLEIEQKNNKSN